MLAASAAMGECIPPSLAMLVLGSVTSLSVAALFAGGLIPAAVIALCLMALIWFMSPAKSRSQRSATMGRLALGAVIPFTMPVFLFAGSMKFIMPIAEMTKQIPLPAAFLYFIGTAEIAGALGLGGVERGVLDALDERLDGIR